MRTILLILNILIGASLVVIPGHESFAASSAKIGKGKAQKNSRSPSKKRKSGHPGDVWVRIRSGMSIPDQIAAFSPKGKSAISSAKYHFPAAEHKSTDGIAAKSRPSKLPQNNYTELGRQKLVKHYYTELGKKMLGNATRPVNEGHCKPAISTSLSKGPMLHKNKMNRSTGAQASSESTRNTGMRIRQRTVIGATTGTDAPPNLPSFENGNSKVSRSTRYASASTKATHCLSNSVATGGGRSNGKMAVNSSGGRFLLDDARSKQAAINERINRQIALYTNKRDFLHRVATRAHPYIYHIVEELSGRRLPLELALLPIVESAYQPTAESSKNARGLWQFIPSTGSDYHLVQTGDYDERLDVTKSTQAAIRFLSGLNAHYHGDWLLTLAAYNAGPGTIDRAMSENRSKGLATDFWSLSLPEETQNYVPRFLALSKIFANPGKFGIKLPSIRNEPYFVKVKFQREFDINYLADKKIDVVARLANLSSEQFCRLNPAFVGPTLARRDAYAFLLPSNSAEQLRQNLARIAQFMSEPVVAVNSVVMKENPEAADLSDPSLSLISELVLDKPAHEAKFPLPFLTLNFDSDQFQSAQDVEPWV